MILSLIQKSKNIMGIRENICSPTSVTPPEPNDLQSKTADKSFTSMERSNSDERELKEFQELIYGCALDNKILTWEENKAKTFVSFALDYIRSIKDPEKPATLEDLHVVYEDGVQVKGVTSGNVKIVEIEFNPTVPHCSLATLIGLCIRVQLERTVAHTQPFKLDIFIKKGAHNTEEEINKQINDKERIAAAMENPNLRKIVEECIQEED